MTAQLTVGADATFDTARQVWVRMERTLTGEVEEHVFGPEGHDVWGYDMRGNYSPVWDRTPFQCSPFPTEHTP